MANSSILVGKNSKNKGGKLFKKKRKTVRSKCIKKVFGNFARSDLVYLIVGFLLLETEKSGPFYFPATSLEKIRDEREFLTLYFTILF